MLSKFIPSLMYSSLHSCTSITIYCTLSMSLRYKNISSNSRLPLPPISILVLSILAAASIQKILAHFNYAALYTTTLPVNTFLTASTLLLHSTEFLPTPIPQTPHGHLPVFCTPWQLPLLPGNHIFSFIHTHFIPSPSMPFFHWVSFLISSSLLSAISTKSSA